MPGSYPFWNELQPHLFWWRILWVSCQRKEEQGFAIGGYESAFLSDLVLYYLFEKDKSKFHPKTYHKIYIGDILVLFIGKRITKKVKDWLNNFQQTVNKAAENQHLQFTTEIWTTENNSPTPSKKERVKIVTNNEFPFLDMKLVCRQRGTCNLACLGKKDKYWSKLVQKLLTHLYPMCDPFRSPEPPWYIHLKKSL